MRHLWANCLFYDVYGEHRREHLHSYFLQQTPEAILLKKIPKVSSACLWTGDKEKSYMSPVLQWTRKKRFNLIRHVFKHQLSRDFSPDPTLEVFNFLSSFVILTPSTKYIKPTASSYWHSQHWLELVVCVCVCVRTYTHVHMLMTE